MGTDAEQKTNFDLKYLFVGEGLKDWYKALGNGWRLFVLLVIGIILAAGVVRIVNFVFPKQKANVNTPKVVALPGARIDKIDQSNVQVSVEEKPWEIGFMGGVFTYDNKNGAAGFVQLKRKF